MTGTHSWVYDDPGWWFNAIHLSCSQNENSSVLNARTSAAQVGASCLEGISAFYNATLHLLSRGTLTIERAASILFRAKALKKWRLANPSQADARRIEALSGFMRRNSEAAHAELVPYPYCVEMRRLLEAWLPEPEGLGCRWTGQFGPGAVAEKLTHPKRFEQLARWCGLDRRHHDFDPSAMHWPDVPLDADEAQHSVARLHAVPKDFSKDRLITIEPSYSSFGQAYVREAMQCSIHCGPLRGTCMDLHYTDGQAIQRRLALKASRTGKLATLDLSDASDGITWAQVQQVFPNWVLSLLDVTRSTRFRLDQAIPGYPAGYEEDLSIFAGMGNGTTFTVETLFFAAFVVAYAHLHSLPGYVSVFGDDIICSSLTARSLQFENFSFFKLNQAKSFIGADALRESCGIFAYNGVDITAPKVDGYPNTWEGRTALADLHKRSYTSPWPYGQRLSYLIAREGRLVNWDRSYPGYPSIDDPRVERSAAPPTRWNKQYQCIEAHLPIRKQASCAYSTDWQSAKRLNQPNPTVWYCASLAGMLGRRDFVVRKSNDRRRWSVDLPQKGRLRTNWSWVAAL